MSLNISCDRCGCTEDIVTNLDNEVTLNFGWRKVVDSLDVTLYYLCPDCCDLLNFWVSKPCDSEDQPHGR